MLDKIIEISQKYIGKTPAEMGLNLWGELRQLLEIEIRGVVKQHADIDIPSHIPYVGIDEREVKCCDIDNDNSIQAGISLCEEEGIKMLRFHFLECHYRKAGLPTIKSQATKTMHLDKQNIDKLIAMLLELSNK